MRGNIKLHEALGGFAFISVFCKRAFLSSKRVAWLLETARTTTITLVLVLALPAAVQAQFVFTTNNGTITITGYTGPGGEVAIPTNIGDLPVTAIGSYAFSHCTNLTSVTIGSGVSSLGPFAFYFCSSLGGVYFNGDAPSVGLGAFSGDNHAIVYYLPGTSGWGTTFAGRPAMPCTRRDPTATRPITA